MRRGVSPLLKLSTRKVPASAKRTPANRFILVTVNYFVYILRCADDTLYCGYTTDIKERVKTHNGETKALGAKYTRGRRPVTLVYSETFKTKSEAMSREMAIKQMTRPQKDKLISS